MARPSAATAALAISLQLLGGGPREAASHGAVTFPPPRNAIDGDKPPWNGAVPKTKLGGEPFGGWCPYPAGNNSTELSGANGQSCFWFS